MEAKILSISLCYILMSFPVTYFQKGLNFKAPRFLTLLTVILRSVWERQPSKLSKIRISAHVQNIQEDSGPLPGHSETSALQYGLSIGTTFALQNLFLVGIVFEAKKWLSFWLRKCLSAGENMGFVPAEGKIILSIKATDYFYNCAINVPQLAVNGSSQQNTSLISELIIAGNSYIPRKNRAESFRICASKRNQKRCQQCNIYSKCDSSPSLSCIGKSAGSYWSWIIALKNQCKWVVY